MQAFNSLASEKDLRRRMMEQGAASAIVALAASSHNGRLRSECVEALCKLAVWPGSEAQIIAEVRLIGEADHCRLHCMVSHGVIRA